MDANNGEHHCPECQNIGKISQLACYQINFEEAIWMCPDDNCCYPLNRGAVTGNLFARPSSEVCMDGPILDDLQVEEHFNVLNVKDDFHFEPLVDAHLCHIGHYSSGLATSIPGDLFSNASLESPKCLMPPLTPVSPSLVSCHLSHAQEIATGVLCSVKAPVDDFIDIEIKADNQSCDSDFFENFMCLSTEDLTAAFSARKTALKVDEDLQTVSNQPYQCLSDGDSQPYQCLPDIDGQLSDSNSLPSVSLSNGDSPPHISLSDERQPCISLYNSHSPLLNGNRPLVIGLCNGDIQPHVCVSHGDIQPHVCVSNGDIQPHVCVSNGDIQPHLVMSSGEIQPLISLSNGDNQSSVKGGSQPHIGMLNGNGPFHDDGDIQPPTAMYNDKIHFQPLIGLSIGDNQPGVSGGSQPHDISDMQHHIGMCNGDIQSHHSVPIADSQLNDTAMDLDVENNSPPVNDLESLAKKLQTRYKTPQPDSNSNRKFAAYRPRALLLSNEPQIVPQKKRMNVKKTAVKRKSDGPDDSSKSSKRVHFCEGLIMPPSKAANKTEHTIKGILKKKSTLETKIKLPIIKLKGICEPILKIL